MRPSRFLRARLSRVIFAWLAFTILATVILLGLIATTIWSVRGTTRWENQIERAENYVGGQLAQTWDDPAARTAEVEALGEDFGFRAVLKDADGAELHVAGPECPPRGNVDLDVRADDGELLGTVTICDPQNPPKRPLGTLLFLLLILWVASAIIARRIARPLDQLADTATKFGEGSLDVRAEVDNPESEIGQLGTAFNRMAERIEQQIEDQKALLAEVSHEMRTPLGHQRILLEMLREAIEDPRHVDALEGEVEAMDHLVEQLLAKSRLGFELARTESLKPADLAVAAMERVDVDPSLLEVDEDVENVAGDASLLGSALTNLLRNAETHGAGVTRFAVESTDEGVAFIVEDAGPGLDDDAKEKLFEPFVAGEGSTGGLGLGLALVGRIVKAHGGELVVESEEGRTRVGFVLSP